MTPEQIAEWAHEAGSDTGRYFNVDADWLARFAALVAAHERERCAKVVEPNRPRPCDCERCDCGNATDARMVAEWDEASAMARRLRAA